MNKILDTLGIWYILKTIVWIIAGETLIKPFARYVMIEVKDLPRVAHYIAHHPGRSFNCHECFLSVNKTVDGINQG